MSAVVAPCDRIMGCACHVRAGLPDIDTLLGGTLTTNVCQMSRHPPLDALERISGHMFLVVHLPPMDSVQEILWAFNVDREENDRRVRIHCESRRVLRPERTVSWVHGPVHDAEGRGDEDIYLQATIDWSALHVPEAFGIGEHVGDAVGRHDRALFESPPGQLGEVHGLARRESLVEYLLVEIVQELLDVLEVVPREVLHQPRY
ncbi:hypothetical protein K466DRAFT_58770 [Polyporus arcularius HHB13444]|uniref:Uncharacterized protein n=1 Tax=Polyporus arcularius HHB13444 TaxID=1314778 RepID=A0A5C3NNZ1_9APHY|nr:hypothetical protein K466DRAFT_58770 [Polyporus arcularius HHB13444]